MLHDRISRWTLRQLGAGIRVSRGAFNSHPKKNLGTRIAIAMADSRDLFNAVRPSIAKLVAAGETGRYHFGSGVVLPEGNLITNCHVTQQAKSVALVQGDAPANANSQASDVVHDLCVLSFPNMRMKPAILRDSRTLKLGETVYAVGFNRGLGLSYQAGYVEELFALDGGVVIRTSAAFTTGASGGGLFDAEGNLVGILTFYRVVANQEPSYYALPVEWIQAAAAAHKSAVAPQQGTPFWAEPLDHQPLFLKAATLEVEGRWAELLSLAREWTQRDPDDGHAWANLGRSLQREGDPAMAEDAFRRAAERGVRRASIP